MATNSQDGFFALAERYCQLGRLLPSADDFDTDDEALVAEAKLVLAEMKKVKAEMDAVLKAAKEKGLFDRFERSCGGSSAV